MARTVEFKINVGTGGSTEVKGNDDQKGGNSVEGGRRLSQAELEERSRKGLCFKCGEKWGKDHMRKFKHLQLVLCEGSGEEENEGESEEESELELEAKTL